MPVADKRAGGRSQIGRVDESMARNDRFISPVVDEAANGVDLAHRVEHADAAFVPRAVALAASPRLPDDGAGIEAKQGANRFFRLHRLPAMRTEAADKALGDDGAERGGKQ